MAKVSRQLGPYEILSVVGSGGMGVVYRARDTRLDRDVAVKVLLPEIATNADALARFGREARAVATLSDPNILAIHDIGTCDGSVFAVMEFLDGPTLRTMLKRGPLPPRKAVTLAVQIAHGLAAAHDRGIVHRDLKPENIGTTRTGQVKILDFGLARDTVSSGLTDSDGTTISRLGMVVGTVGYMSPEQVRGEHGDHRSDLFSFGVVLYEMLTNRRPFSRATGAETLTAILNDDPPDLEESGAKVPPALDHVVRRCFEKNPEDRFHSACDLAFALENALAPTGGDTATPARASRSLPLTAALVAGSLVVGALAMAFLSRPVGEAREVRFLTFSGVDSEPTASPTGDQIVYTSSRGGEPTLWIREVDGGNQRAIVERDLHIAGAHSPRFFRDGKRLLFLRKDASSESAYEANINGGNRDRLLENVSEAEPSPTDDDEIAFVRLGIDASGKNLGTLGVFNVQTKATNVLLQETGAQYANPRWSPDGRLVATVRRSGLGASGSSIVVIDQHSRARHELKPQGRGAFGALAWNGDGRAIIATESPDAQVFVPGALARILKIDVESGGQQLLFKQDNLFGLFGTADANATIEVAGDGRLVFSSIEIRQNLRECTISGESCIDAKVAGRVPVNTTGSSNDRQPAYSPDGAYAIFSSNRSGDLDLWIQSTKDGAVSQLTQDAELDWDPAFTPDGKHVLWSSDRETGHLEIWIADFDSARLDRGGLSGVRRVSADGKDAENPTMTKGLQWVVYASSNPARAGIWKVRPDGRDATRLVPGAVYYIPDVSPDGRYTAYLQVDNVNLKNTIRVVDTESGRDFRFEIAIPYQRQLGSGDVTWGRARWTQSANWLLFIGQDNNGRAAVYKQRFSPAADTTATRQRIVSSLPGALIESLVMSPDDRFLTVSDAYHVRRLVLAEHVNGVVGRRRTP